MVSVECWYAWLIIFQQCVCWDLRYYGSWRPHRHVFWPSPSIPSELIVVDCLTFDSVNPGRNPKRRVPARSQQSKLKDDSGGSHIIIIILVARLLEKLGLGLLLAHGLWRIGCPSCWSQCISERLLSR